MKLFLALCALALSFSARAETPFSTNDLSILFPLVDEKPKFVVHPADADWRVLSRANFEKVLETAAAQETLLNDKLKDPASWHLVAMRYVPCTLFAGQACREQLRFVFQSFGAERSQSGFDDYAMHVVYDFAALPAPQLSPRLESFRKIKNAFGELTLDKALAAHPMLASAKGETYFRALQTEVIAKHVNARAPSHITFLGLGFAHGSRTETNSDHWVFFQGDVGADGLWRPVTLSVGAPLISEHMQLTEDEMGLATNVKPAPGQIEIINSTGEREKDVLKMLDQRRSNDHNVGCASCHIADSQHFPVLFDRDDKKGRAKFLKIRLAALQTEPRVSEVLIDNAIHIGRMGFEVPAVRIFGYLDGRALVSQRVVNDSALAVSQANTLLGLQPKSQCVSAKEREALLSCLYLGDYEATLAACMKKSCRQ